MAEPSVVVLDTDVWSRLFAASAIGHDLPLLANDRIYSGAPGLRLFAL